MVESRPRTSNGVVNGAFEAETAMAPAKEAIPGNAPRLIWLGRASEPPGTRAAAVFKLARVLSSSTQKANRPTALVLTELVKLPSRCT